MYKFICSIFLYLIISVTLVFVPLVDAKEVEKSSVPTTTADVTSPLEVLELMVKPLTVEELGIEVEGWLGLLKAKVREVSVTEISSRQQKAGETVAQSDSAGEVAEQIAGQRSRALEHLNELHAQRTALIDRVKLVVAEFKTKGGDEKKVELYNKYTTAVSGRKVDVSDAQAAWVTIYGWLTSEEGGIRWIKNISMFIFIVIAFFVLSRLLSKALSKALEVSGRVPELLMNFLVSGIRRLVIIIGIIIGLAALEVNIGPLMAVIGAAGFVIAFALQDSLSNFASGILILLYHPFDVGDVVEAGGVSGSVNSMNLLSTHIRTFDNKLMIVPNNDIWGGVITNATGTDKRRVDMVFGIGYADDIDKAQHILEGIVSAHKLVLEDPQPVVCVHELADSSVNFICRPWVQTEDYWTVYWDVTRSVKERFDEQGVSIPFPQRDVHVYNETSM
ncbi:MAG: mechanosensitive ion channel family protein [Gammaproteobacteria bacterium]|nr:mechanosensitive ion channel family protein [Gammaproteobacteria bacterium]